MSHLPKGFLGSAIAAGLKSNGDLDLALIVNRGPEKFGTAVFTRNRVEAAPVTWSRQVVRDLKVEAIILNSGGANACTGPEGFALVHQTAERIAGALKLSSSDVLVCSTGMIGVQLPQEKLFAGIDTALSSLESGPVDSLARAIMTTDSKPKIASYEKDGWSIVGIAKGAGMLAPSLATMLVVLMTDAVIDEDPLSEVTSRTFDRIDSDGCTSTNDTVSLLASGASGIKPSAEDFAAALEKVCNELARGLIADAEGHTKVIRINTVHAASEADAVAVGRAVARNNLFKCAITGEDPNWGRILAAVGTTHAIFDASEIDLYINGVRLCHRSSPDQPRDLVNMSDVLVEVVIDLNAGKSEATIWTNDLSAMYVHENSAYST